jgi:hypothetical protein
MIQSEDPSPAEIHERAAQIRSTWSEEEHVRRRHYDIFPAYPADGRQVERAARWHLEVRRQAERAERHCWGSATIPPVRLG